MGEALKADAIEELATALKRALRDFEVGEAEASPTVRHRVEGAILALDGVRGRLGDEDLFETITTEWSSSSRLWG